MAEFIGTVVRCRHRARACTASRRRRRRSSPSSAAGRRRGRRSDGGMSSAAPTTRAHGFARASIPSGATSPPTGAGSRTSPLRGSARPDWPRRRHVHRDLAAAVAEGARGVEHVRHVDTRGAFRGRPAACGSSANPTSATSRRVASGSACASALRLRSRPSIDAAGPRPTTRHRVRRAGTGTSRSTGS